MQFPQKITAHVAMVDAFPKKLEGEGMDYCHGLSLIESPRIDFDTGNVYIHTYIYI